MNNSLPSLLFYGLFLLGGYFFYHILQKQVQTSLFANANKNLNNISQSQFKNFFVSIWMFFTHASFDSFFSHLLILSNTGYIKLRDYLSLFCGSLFSAFIFNQIFTYFHNSNLNLQVAYLAPLSVLYVFAKLRPYIKTLFLGAIFVLGLNLFFSGNNLSFENDLYLLLFPLLFPSLVYWPFVFTFIGVSETLLPLALLSSIFSYLLYRLLSAAKGNTNQRRVIVVSFLIWLLLAISALCFFSYPPLFAYVYCYLVLLIAIPICPLWDRLSQFVIREKNHKEANELRWIEPLGVYHVAYFTEILFSETKKKAALVLTMLEHVRSSMSLEVHDIAVEKKLQKYEKITDSMQSEIIFFTERLMQFQMSHYSAEKLRAILRISGELESMADTCIALFKMIDRMQGLVSENDYFQKVKDYFDKTVLYYEQVFDELQNKGFFERDTAPTRTSLELAQNLSEIRKSMYQIIDKGDLRSDVAAYAVEWNAQIKKLKGHISNIYQAHQGIR